MEMRIKKLVFGIGIFSTITLVCLMLSSFNKSTSSYGDVYTIVGTGSGIYRVSYNPSNGHINRVTKYTGNIDSRSY